MKSYFDKIIIVTNNNKHDCVLEKQDNYQGQQSCSQSDTPPPNPVCVCVFLETGLLCSFWLAKGTVFSLLGCPQNVYVSDVLHKFRLQVLKPTPRPSRNLRF